MKYPKVYYQMQAMMAVCERMRDKSEHREYFDMLAEELQLGCEVIEAEYMENADEFTGELEDLGDMDVSGMCGEDIEAVDMDEAVA